MEISKELGPFTIKFHLNECTPSFKEKVENISDQEMYHLGIPYIYGSLYWDKDEGRYRKHSYMTPHRNLIDTLISIIRNHLYNAKNL